MDYIQEKNEYVLNDINACMVTATPGLRYSVQLKADHLFHRNATSNVTIFKNRRPSQCRHTSY